MNLNMKINLESLKEKKELVSVFLLCCSVLLIVLTFVEITRSYSDTTKIENTLLRATKQSEISQEEIDKVLASTQQFADKLKQNNAFAPYVRQDQVVQAPTNPVTEVRAILGKSALINNRWYTVNESIGSAKIVAIEPMFVTIEFNSIKTDYYPIRASLIEPSTTQTNGFNMSGGNMISGMGNIMNMNVSDILQTLTGGRGGRGGGMMGGMGGMGGGRGGGMGGGRGGRGGGGGGGGMGGGRGGGGGFGGFGG
jgi:hypothetical protein